MKELLFSCESERIALENVLAFNQVRKCDEGINKYNEEIEDLKNEIRDILEIEGITEDYVGLISKYKKELRDLDTSKVRNQELENRLKSNDEKINGFNLKIKELESELEDMKRVIFDSDDAKIIVDTQKKVEQTNKRLADLYDLVETLNNDNTTVMIEKEFIKTRNIESDFNTPAVIKVEISNELQRISIEFENVIKQLELAVREDVEFCLKKISNREKEIAKYEDRKSNIVSEYPEVLEIDFYDELDKLDNLFEELDSCFETDECLCDDCNCESCDTCKEECDCDDDCDCDESCDCGCQDEDLENVVIDFNDNEEEEENVEFDDATEVDITTDMVHVESIEKPDLELREVTEASELMEEDKEDSEEEIEVDDSSSFSTIGSVPYIFSEGESLESIAEKVYPSKDCWEAIYNYNKEEIDSYLTANGISNDLDSIKTLASDKYLFAGIQLNIPTDANYKG